MAFTDKIPSIVMAEIIAWSITCLGKRILCEPHGMCSMGTTAYGCGAGRQLRTHSVLLSFRALPVKLCHDLWPWLLIVLSLLLYGCRTSHQQPAAALSSSQEKLVNLMNTAGHANDAPIVLSVELKKLAAEYRNLTGDSSSDAEAHFTLQLDSAVLRLSSKCFMQTDPAKIVSELNMYLFTTWGITFNGDRDNVKYLFPSHVLSVKQGSCVGMSLLYLLLAEKMGIPLYGVLAPGHFFVRFDNGSTKINIETLRKGECMAEAWYREKYSIHDTIRYSMRNLTVAEVVGIVCYNLGTICFHDRRYDQAVTYLERASGCLTDFPEAQGNCALALDARGDSEKALAMLIAIKRKYPAFEKIDNNIASLQLKCGKYDDALASYTALSLQQADNAQYHYGRGVAFYRLQRPTEAVAELTRAVELSADCKEAKELLVQLTR
jgi:regulator of sirC expression with transglutaminase-like and TPR domain